MWKTFILILIFVNSIILCYSKENVIVKIENGQVKGEVAQFRNKTINIFTGIRYGKPPVGDFRFKKSEKVDNWTGIFDATTKKYSCWQQLYYYEAIGIHIKDMNEDCLFLNVWAPQQQINNNNNNKTKSLPVMVWFYGGALAFGSIFQETLVYNGIVLSTYDVIVVTVNYRVGPLGFLYGGNNDAPGNAGLYDQNLALKWVQTNIHAFGGDPDDVTIFGQSAGGWSVSYHILSPLSRNLFKKAIIQSGATHSLISHISKSKSLRLTQRHAMELGCKNNSKLVECLKKVQPIKLHNYTNDVLDKEYFVPVYGTEFYPMNSFQALKSGKFNTNVTVLTGVTVDEGSNLVFFRSGEDLNEINLTNSYARELINKTISNWKNLQSQTSRDKIVDYYISNITDESQLKNKIGHIFGDYMIECPTYLFAKDMVEYSNNIVYFYLFDYKSKKLPSDCYFDWMGICHTEDVPLVFGTPVRLAHNYTQNHIQLSLLTMNLWTTFAKTGNPMGKQSENSTNIIWPKLQRKPNNDKIDVITKVMQLPQHFGTILIQPFKENCDNLWRLIFENKQQH